MTALNGTVLVTGANGGLGSAIVSQIISTPEFRAFHGIYTVRDTTLATPALDAALRDARLSTPTSPSHSYQKLSLDLSRQSSVRGVAKDINTRVAAGELAPIRAIVLNAGYQEFSTQTWTTDGLDTTFAVNYLSHWLLLLLLLQSVDRVRGRVVWISSWSHNRDHRFQPLIGAYNDKRYMTIISNSIEQLAKGTWSANADDKTAWAAGYRRYGASKLCSVAMINELQHRLDHDSILNKVSVLAVDPGIMATDIVRRSNSWFLRVFLFQILLPALVALNSRLFPNGILRTLKKSASDVMAAAFNCGPPPLSEWPKGLYLDGSHLGEYNADAKDPIKREVLWECSVRYADLKEGECMLERWE